MKCCECKYWENKLSDHDLKDDIRVCFKAKQLWDCTEWIENDDECKWPNEKYYSRKLTEKYKNQKMFVQDGSSYSASLLTKADFYCAHFEIKE